MKSQNISTIQWNIFKDLPVTIGVTTRNGGFSKGKFNSLNLATYTGDDYETVLKNRQLLVDSLNIPINNYTYGIQMHGVNIHEVNKNNISVKNIECDALMTNEKNTLLNIFVADCVPIAIYDSKKCVGALCHCGWKGTYNKLLQLTIKKFIDDYSSNPEDLLIGIGPSIGSCCYNVSKELYNQFSPKDKEGYILNNKYFLNLKTINKNQAKELGIVESNIEVLNYCTSCNNHMFYSYRKEGEPSGRFSCYMSLTS